jgi:hypothetical protein
MLSGLPFANIAHLGWAVRDIDTTIQNFENLGLGPWRRYILGEAGCECSSTGARTLLVSRDRAI